MFCILELAWKLDGLWWGKPGGRVLANAEHVGDSSVLGGTWDLPLIPPPPPPGRAAPGRQVTGCVGACRVGGHCLRSPWLSWSLPGPASPHKGKNIYCSGWGWT